MKIDRFRLVGCPDSAKRWVLAKRVHCNIVVSIAGYWNWAAWIEDEDGGIGPMDSGRAADAVQAELLAKHAAILLYTEDLASSSERGSCPLALATKADGSRDPSDKDVGSW